MTTEEKAKAYDEALEKARKRVVTEPQDHTDAILKDIFPELRESEDKRTRKEIIEFLRSQIEDGNSVGWDRWIAYLEKQKEPENTSASVMAPSCWEVGQKEQNECPEFCSGHCVGCKQKEQKPAQHLPKEKVFDIMRNLTALSYSERIPINSDEYGWIHKITEDVRSLLDYPIEQKPADGKEYSSPECGTTAGVWSEEDGMETINVFRPLAGTSIESATKQAVNKFTNSGKKFLLAFNGVFILIDNTKSVQDIVTEYNRSLGGKKKEQEQSEGEPNDFEITLNDCMLAAQQYPPGKIGWDDVKMWAEELSNYCPQPNQKWSEFDKDCLKRAIWYIENPAIKKED